MTRDELPDPFDFSHSENCTCFVCYRRKLWQGKAKMGYYEYLKTVDNSKEEFEKEYLGSFEHPCRDCYEGKREKPCDDCCEDI